MRSFASWTGDLGKSLLVFGSRFLTSPAGLRFSQEDWPVEREHIASRLLRCPRLSVGGVRAGPNRGSSVLASSGNFLGAPLKVGHPADMTDLHLGAFESFLNSWLPSDPCRCPARGRRVEGGGVLCGSHRQMHTSRGSARPRTLQGHGPGLRPKTAALITQPSHGLLPRLHPPWGLRILLPQGT